MLLVPFVHEFNIQDNVGIGVSILGSFYSALSLLIFTTNHSLQCTETEADTLGFVARVIIMMWHRDDSQFEESTVRRRYYTDF